VLTSSEQTTLQPEIFNSLPYRSCNFVSAFVLQSAASFCSPWGGQS